MSDITDPDTLADAKKVLDLSLVKYRDKVKFLGAWFRQRPTAMPISFNEKNLRAFAEKRTKANVSRDLICSRTSRCSIDTTSGGSQNVGSSSNPCVTICATKIGPEAILLYTNDASEPGRALPRSITGEGQKDAWQWMQVVVNQDMATWEKVLSDASKYPWVKPYDFRDVVDKDMHLRGLQSFAENWDKWEMAHATPPDDPQTYQDGDGVLLSYTYNRLYTVSSSRPLDAYRTKSGLAIMRHYSLNENEMNVGNDEILGYFVCDVERAGPYSMMAEARAVAYGDPYYLGSLTGNSNKRGFPRYVRRFHAAFLALPALPGSVVPGAVADPEVFVRAIPTAEHGTYVAIVNTGFQSKQDVLVTLPPGTIRDAVSGEQLSATEGKLTLRLDPAELRTLRIQ